MSRPTSTAEPAADLTFSFVGEVRVTGPAGSVTVRGPQPSLLLARLVLDRPRPLARHELVEMLWPDELPDHWAGAARKVVSRARRTIVEAGAHDGLYSRGGQVGLELPADLHLVVDVDEVAAEVARAEAAVTAGDWATARQVGEAAADALGGPFLAGAEGVWVDRRRARLDALAQRALHAASQGALESGDLGPAVEIARRAIERDPFDELATRQSMQALAREGSTAGALADYERLRFLLDEQLGVRPAPETEALYLSLLGEEPPVARSSAAVGRPGRSPHVDHGPFVGRATETEALHDEWEAAADGVRVVVVEGEPGIGKTRLVADFAERRRAEGTTVLWARCDPEVSIAHGPFTDLLRQLVDEQPDLINRLGSVAARLVALLPELLPSADLAISATSVQARARLARAVTTALATAADRPLLVVIDDLQWADGDTLALLGHVIPRLAAVPCLITTTVRDHRGEVAATLAELQSAVPVTTLTLDGLATPELGDLLEQSDVVLSDGPTAAAQVLADRTGGNPLYVTQLVREAEATHDPFDPEAVPLAVTQLLERRLAALGADASGVLTLAAIVGPEFALSTLDACSNLSPDAVLDIIEDLCRQRFVAEVDAGRFRFAHALVRDVVLATASATRREQLHLRVAEALGSTTTDPGVVAHHLVASGPAAVDAALHASLAAGDAALERSAWSSASEHYGNAVRLAEEVDLRADALIGLGRAQRGAGAAADARLTLHEALDLATANHEPRAVAAATLAMIGGGGRGVAIELDDAERSQLLRDALEGLGPDDVDLAVPILSELALSLVLADAAHDREALCDRCLAEARRWGDPGGLITALQAKRTVLMGPAGTEARFADGQEAVALAHSSAPAESSVSAHLGLVEDLLELGHRPAARIELDRAASLAARLDHPYWSWSATTWRALDAIVDGRLDEAEALAFAAVDHQAAGDHPEAVAALGVNLVNIRLFQGRSGEVVDLLRAAADENPHIPAYRAVLALCCAEAGAFDDADAAYATFRATGFDLPADSNWLLATAVLADTCATLGDAESATLLASHLDPWTDRHVVLNCYGGGGAYWGPVTHHLGRLAALRGDLDDAERLLHRARLQAERFGAPAFAARSEAALALAGGGSGGGTGTG